MVQANFIHLISGLAMHSPKARLVTLKNIASREFSSCMPAGTTVSSMAGNHSIGLSAYKERISNKTKSAKYVIRPSASLDFDLATRLTGAALGYEGENVFPTLFVSNNSKWTPPVRVINRIKIAVKQELSRELDTGAYFLSVSDYIRHRVYLPLMKPLFVTVYPCIL